MRVGVYRLAMWQGDFAFEMDTLRYRGKIGDNALHAHFALQLVQGVDGPVSVETPDGVITGSNVAIGSLVRHRLCRQEDAIVRWIEPSSAKGRALATRCRTPITNLDDAGPQHPAPAMNEAVRAAIGRVAAGQPSLTGVARDIGISPQKLRLASRVALGGSLRHWTLWLKLGRAARAIVDGVPLAQAAADGGFADQAHLNRTMRAMFGITPGALRSAAHG